MSPRLLHDWLQSPASHEAKQLKIRLLNVSCLLRICNFGPNSDVHIKTISILTFSIGSNCKGLLKGRRDISNPVASLSELTNLSEMFSPSKLDITFESVERPRIIWIRWSGLSTCSRRSSLTASCSAARCQQTPRHNRQHFEGVNPGLARCYKTFPHTLRISVLQYGQGM